MNNKKIIIAIDGYSECGKSSTAKLLAKELPDFILQPIVFRYDIKQNQLIKIPITIQKHGNATSTDIQVYLMHEERILNQQSVMFSSD